MPISQRLKSARLRAGYKTAREAAAKLGVPYGTYSGHENGSRGIKAEEMLRYAKFFNVTAPWLSFGSASGAPKRQRFAILNGRTGYDTAGSVEFYNQKKIELTDVELDESILENADQAPGGTQFLPLPNYITPAFEGAPRTISIRVDGDKLVQKWAGGSTLYFDFEKYEASDSFSPIECICWIDDGSAIIGRPLTHLVKSRRIVSVSPLVMHLTSVGLTLWFETIAASFTAAVSSLRSEGVD